MDSLLAKVLIGIAVAAAGLFIGLRIYNFLQKTVLGKGGGRERWSHGIRFSNQQLTAMRSLWQWYRTGRSPTSSSLQHLSTAEVADLLTKCELDYIPRKYHTPDERDERDRFMKDLLKQGMDEVQAQVVTGMKFGRLGPARE